MTAGPGVGPGGRGGGGPDRVPGREGRAGAPVDLDAPPPTAPPSTAAAPAPGAVLHRRRRLAAWALVAALVGAGIGSAVTARQAGAREEVREQDDRRERAVLALQAGAPSLVSGAGAPDAQGRSAVTLSVPVINRGPDPVRVRVLGLVAPGQSAAGRPPLVTVAAGTTFPASVPVLVRCADVLPPTGAGGSRGAGDSELRVRVVMPDGDRVASLPLVERSGPSVPGLLSYACGPPRQRRAPVSVTWTPRDDGSLEVVVGAPLLGGDLALDLVQSPGLGVSADTVLPLAVAPLERATLVLTVEPTCSAVAPPGRAPAAGFDVVTVRGGEVQAAVGDVDGVKAAWTARQLALRCG